MTSFLNFLISNDMVEKIVPVIDEGSCTGCGGCEDTCRSEAISMVDRDLTDPRRRISEQVARINVEICTGCDACVGSCEDISWPKEEA